MRYTIVERAKSLGLEPDVREPRNQTHSNNSEGGPDISMNQTEGTRMLMLTSLPFRTFLHHYSYCAVEQEALPAEDKELCV